MKQILLLLAIIPILTFAQIEKGIWVGGSNLSLNISNEKPTYANYLYANFTIAPNFGYSIKKNFVIGGGVSYNLVYEKIVPKTSENFPVLQNSHSPGFNFFIKKYFMKGKFGGFVLWNTGAEVGQFNYENSNPNLPLNSRIKRQYATSFRTALSLGLCYFLNEHWALEIQYGSLGYKYTHNFASNTTSNIFDKGDFHKMAIGFTPDYLFLNLRYYFDKKKK